MAIVLLRCAPRVGALCKLEFHEVPEAMEFVIQQGVPGVVLELTTYAGTAGATAASSKNGGLPTGKKKARVLATVEDVYGGASVSSSSNGTLIAGFVSARRLAKKATGTQKGKAGTAGKKGGTKAPVTLLTAMRTPSQAGGLAYEKQVNGWAINRKLAVSFLGCSQADLPTTRRIGGDCIDRVFTVNVPVLRTVKPKVDENIVTLRFLGVSSRGGRGGVLRYSRMSCVQCCTRR
jgi:hypothetical protein